MPTTFILCCPCINNNRACLAAPQRHEGDREQSHERWGENGDSGVAAQRSKEHCWGGRPQMRWGDRRPSISMGIFSISGFAQLRCNFLFVGRLPVNCWSLRVNWREQKRGQRSQSCKHDYIRNKTELSLNKILHFFFFLLTGSAVTWKRSWRMSPTISSHWRLSLKR